MSTTATAAGMGDGAVAAHGLSPLSWEWRLGGRGGLGEVTMTIPGNGLEEAKAAAEAFDRNPRCRCGQAHVCATVLPLLSLSSLPCPPMPALEAGNE